MRPPVVSAVVSTSSGLGRPCEASEVVAPSARSLESTRVARQGVPGYILVSLCLPLDFGVPTTRLQSAFGVPSKWLGSGFAVPSAWHPLRLPPPYRLPVPG
ncbi:hypothetical protein GCM10010350_44770 [Streptomyces galilaeus]|nr:hypothetical protein GCM10010350_44770 [Streptomyces galilaeus]